MVANFFRFLTAATCLALGVQVALVCTQVLAEGLIPDAFTREVSKYLMTWVTLLGLPLVIRGERLLAIHFGYAGPVWWRRARNWTRLGATFLLCGVLLGYGVWNVVLTLESGTTTGALAWPKAWVIIALPVGMVLAVVALFTRPEGEDEQA